jgi:spore coat protein U-like protein
MTVKYLLRYLLMAAALLAGLPAWSAISCSMVLNPVQVKGIYTTAAGLDVTGTLTLTCTRNPAVDARRQDIWIGMTQPAAGRTATLDTGGSTVAYTVAHRGYASGIWTNTGGVAATSGTNAAVTERLDFGNGGGATVTAIYSYYFRAAAAQVKPAGVYIDSVPITVLLGTTSAGTALTTGSLGILLSIPKSCRFSTPPSAIAVNYQAFSSLPVNGTSTFALTCTQGTTYTLALDRTRSVIPVVDLTYGLALTAATAVGSAIAQGYNVLISVDARQAGRCNGAVCTGTDIRTLTITY